MARKSVPRERKVRDNPKKFKKKANILGQESAVYVDWKDVNLLRRFLSDRGKIRSRRVTGVTTQQQRAVALAIKTAREMALLPYAVRVTSSRGAGRGGSGGGGRGRDREDRSLAGEDRSLASEDVRETVDAGSADVAVEITEPMDGVLVDGEVAAMEAE